MNQPASSRTASSPDLCLLLHSFCRPWPLHEAAGGGRILTKTWHRRLVSKLYNMRYRSNKPDFGNCSLCWLGTTNVSSWAISFLGVSIRRYCLVFQALRQSARRNGRMICIRRNCSPQKKQQWCGNGSGVEQHVDLCWTVCCSIQLELCLWEMTSRS